jgi:hypothetical protein
MVKILIVINLEGYKGFHIVNFTIKSVKCVWLFKRKMMDLGQLIPHVVYIIIPSFKTQQIFVKKFYSTTNLI